MHTHLLTIMISRMYRKQALITLLMLFAFVALLSCEQCHHQLTAILGAPKEERPHGTPFASSSLRRQQSVSVDVANDSTLVEPITQISILGERNSGTSWTFDHLSTCFNHSLHVERHLTRYKHWFQDPNANQYGRRHNTLVLVQSRDPYDWLEAMRYHAHHSPEHLDLEWNEFLTKPWTMERIGLDLNITDTSYRCQQGFRFDEIVSCHKEPLPHEAYSDFRMSRHQPFYELKPGGQAFQNIMELRSAKIGNFLETKNYPNVSDVWPVQYEYLLSRGTKQMLDQISQVTGVEYKCEPFPTQHRSKRTLTKAFVEHVDKHLDWDIEALVGYHRKENNVINTHDGFILNKDELTRYFSDQKVVGGMM